MNELLQKIIAFQGKNGRLYDLNFSLPASEELDLLKDFKDKTSYKKIAQHYSGSLICIYDASGLWTGEDGIIKWIDAKGEPNLPIASSFRDFLSILPYGTGIMYDVLYLINKHRGKPELDQFIEEDYPQKVWADQLVSNKSHYPNHDLLINFLSENGISIAKDALEIIKKANQI